MFLMLQGGLHVALYRQRRGDAFMTYRQIAVPDRIAGVLRHQPVAQSQRIAKAFRRAAKIARIHLDIAQLFYRHAKIAGPAGAVGIDVKQPAEDRSHFAETGDGPGSVAQRRMRIAHPVQRHQPVMNDIGRIRRQADQTIDRLQRLAPSIKRLVIAAKLQQHRGKLVLGVGKITQQGDVIRLRAGQPGSSPQRFDKQGLCRAGIAVSNMKHGKLHQRKGRVAPVLRHRRIRRHHRLPQQQRLLMQEHGPGAVAHRQLDITDPFQRHAQVVLTRQIARIKCHDSFPQLL
ncbi:MAG: hypothetical protein ACK4P8_06140 [Tabrizicola sp.]